MAPASGFSIIVGAFLYSIVFMSSINRDQVLWKNKGMKVDFVTLQAFFSTRTFTQYGELGYESRVVQY